MLYSNDTLSSMTGSVRNHKQNADAAQIEQWLNWRMRFMLDQRPIWAGGITRGVLSIPPAYGIGTISTTTGSQTVVGLGQVWPVTDVVNTVLPNAIRQIGNQVVQPADMTNIVADTWLYVDSGGPNPEVVYVLATTPQAFTAVFKYQHNAGSTATCSSYAGRTLRLGYQVPNYLIIGVVDASTLLIEIPYAGPPITNGTYTILKNLYNFAPDMKELMSAVDPQQGVELGLNYPQTKLNQEDPQRASTDFPILVSPYAVSPAGTMLFEIWPSPTSARQIYFEYYKQPQDMRAPGDRPPPYLNPQVIVMGAIADAYRTKISPDDPYFDLQVAENWEMRFMSGLEMLKYADNSLYDQSYTWRSGAEGYPTGATWNRSHDSEAWNGNW